MSFPSFLRELGQLIQRAVISCVYPRLIALDTVNELAGLTDLPRTGHHIRWSRARPPVRTPQPSAAVRLRTPQGRGWHRSDRDLQQSVATTGAC